MSHQENDTTKAFLAELSRSAGIPADVLVVAITTGPNEGRGTWVHPQVGYHLAQWCSPAFAVTVTEWIADIHNKGYATIEGVAFRDPMDVLRDPAAMRGLLLTYSEKVLELEATVATQAPKVDAFDRIAAAEGSMCVTDAAKDLQVRPKDLFNWMSGSRWIYQRPGKAGYLAYQDKIQAGYLKHKVTTVSRSDGSEKVVEAVRVTARGLAKLAQKVPGARRPGPSPQAAE